MTAGRPSEKGIRRDSTLWENEFVGPVGPVRNGFGKACRPWEKLVLGRELALERLDSKLIVVPGRKKLKMKARWQ